MTDDPSPSSFLPLRPVEFQVMLSLGSGARHGYGIIQDAEARGEDRAVPGLATLYRALRRLQSQGLVVRVDDGAGDDDRRQPFALTDLGRAVAEMEARRLEIQVRAARAAHLLGEGVGR